MTPEIDAAAARLLAELSRRRFGLGHVLTSRLFAAPFGRLPANHTYSQALKLEAGFDMVRLIYANDQPHPIEITAASVAAASAIAPGAVPLDPGGTPAPWTRLTFNNTPGAPLIIPGSPTPGIPIYAGSDWAPLPSLPPAENDGRPWLLTRSFVARDARCILIGPDDFAAFAAPDQHQGRPIQATHQEGDHVSSTGPMTHARPYGFIAPVAVQYRTYAAGLNVMCVGDSITAGVGSRSRNAGWGLRACAALSQPNRPVSFLNAGWDGARTQRFHHAAATLIATTRPHIVVIAAYSPNDTYDVETPPLPWQTGLTSALDLAVYAARLGCLPILTTPLPWIGTGAATEAARLAVRDTLHRFAARGLLLCDLDHAVSDHADLPRLRAGCTEDGIHPNETGYVDMAKVAAAALNQAIDVRQVSVPRTNPIAASSPVSVHSAFFCAINVSEGHTSPDRKERSVATTVQPIGELEIRFAKDGNSAGVATDGWGHAETHGRWSNGTESRLILPGPFASAYRVIINLGPFLAAPHIDHQELRIVANDRDVWSDTLRENRRIEFTIPAGTIGESARLELRFICPTARSPSSFSDSTDVRVLGFSIWNLRLERLIPGGFPVILPAAVALAVPRPRVAAVTMVYNEAVYLPIWLKHYGAQVGIENCYVVDHGSDDGSTEGLVGCNVVRIPRSPYDPHKQSAFNSMFCSSMTHWYDRVIYSDVDEILLADPKIASDLTEYCRRPLPDVVTAIGLNNIHRPDDESPFDPARPVSIQRPYVFCASSMCKPLLIRKPIVWSPGSHSSDAPTVFDHLYMFHLRWFDLPYGLQRLRKTREMAWAHDIAGAHQRSDDAKLEATHRGFARLRCRDGLEFDPATNPIQGFTNEVLASRAGRENQVYKIDLGIWARELWRLPERFIGTF